MFVKLSKKQEKELKVLEWFNYPGSRKSFLLDSTIGIEKVQESDSGITAEEAFFMKSERGRFPESVKDKERLREILWSKVWRERHLSEIWTQEDINKGYLLPQDFLEEPDYIREFVLPRIFNLPGDWRPRE